MPAHPLPIIATFFLGTGLVRRVAIGIIYRMKDEDRESRK
jgi:hypothetical protein